MMRTRSICRGVLNPVRGSLIGALAVILIGIAVVLAHTGPTGHVMGSDPGGDHEVVSMCLAIMQAGGAVLVAFLLGASPGRKRAITPIVPVVAFTSIRVARLDPGSRIREGPSCQQVFRN